MKNIQWIFVLYAILAALSLMLIGIAIGERSPLGIITAVVLFIIIMGLGFKKKRSIQGNKE